MTNFENSYGDRLATTNAAIATGASLARRATSFMFGTAALIKDPLLSRATDQYWALPSALADVRGTHRFNCSGAEGIRVADWLYTGRAIVPQLVEISFDVSPSSHAISYRFAGQEHEDPHGLVTRELTLVLTNPRDVIGNSWQASVSDHAEHDPRFPGADTSLSPLPTDRSSDDFAAIANEVQASLLPATIERMG